MKKKITIIISLVLSTITIIALFISLINNNLQTQLGEVEKAELKGMQETVPEGYTGIYTVEDLKGIKENLVGNYILMNDIDLESKPFRTIGSTASEPFKGTFDGNGYKISNLTISQDNQYVGLFGYVTGGTIKNLTLENVDITSIYTTDTAYAGGLIGYMREGTIENVSVSGNIKEEGESSKYIYIGGLIGKSEYKITVTDSHTTTDIKVNTKNSYLGGLIGMIDRANNSTIKNSYATGDITTELGGQIGGLIGYVNPSQAIITDSYATGDITVGRYW